MLHIDNLKRHILSLETITGNNVKLTLIEIVDNWYWKDTCIDCELSQEKKKSILYSYVFMVEAILRSDLHSLREFIEDLVKDDLHKLCDECKN